MRIGILGGTFDPIHFGHIRPALEVKAKLKLDSIWLMPNHIPPHKQATNTSTAHRLAMVSRVCDIYPELVLCDIEIRRDTPSYTVTSLEALTQAYPQHEFYFIMGMDSFMQLESWYRWQDLFNLCHIVVCQRPGWTLDDESNMAKLLGQLSKTWPLIEKNTGLIQHKTGHIFPVEIAEQDVSSTDIRDKIRRGDDLTQLLPASIIAYIKDNNLYH
jgi:nicotinate-nucleotide adenylyltransferase